MLRVLWRGVQEMATSGERSEFRLACAVWPHCARCAFQVQSEGPTWEFNPESGALGVARCPSGALSGALIRASSSTVWSRDLQASRGQWPLPAVHPIGAQNHHDVGTFCVRRSPGDSAAATGWSGERRSMGPLAVSFAMPVLHCERMLLGSRQKHAWIADSLHQTGARR